VEKRSSPVSSTAESGTGLRRIPECPALIASEEAPTVFAGAGASTMVFHSLQAGHWPSHLADSCPQLLQKKTVLIFFAIFHYLY
jgi:hypothetical protein